MTFEIETYLGNVINLLQDSPVYHADTGRKALDLHLKAIGFNGKVKCSASNDVQFKVTPIVFDENGRKWINGSKRALWYEVVL